MVTVCGIRHPVTASSSAVSCCSSPPYSCSNASHSSSKPSIPPMEYWAVQVDEQPQLRRGPRNGTKATPKPRSSALVQEPADTRNAAPQRRMRKNSEPRTSFFGMCIARLQVYLSDSYLQTSVSLSTLSKICDGTSTWLLPRPDECTDVTNTFQQGSVRDIP